VSRKKTKVTILDGLELVAVGDLFRRWEAFTGSSATLFDDGRTFAEATEART
jgi:hypothetical protein